MRIDIDKLRRDLIDFYGTAAYNGFPAAMMDVIDVENVSPEKLIQLANRAGFRLEDYQEEELER